ncbi:pyridoxal phosphatase [Fistulifera solaris]|uniref:Pyridoxal phosphatase n=1 Tax=Fistulifera solaris TaxID=1519565 RepID=A0A1Z5JMZ9_FISSO|nr:pyridoxal phosphatase [Fistulifera solaris]|eukprot:GAX15349.1 pyridoxal phosphatase [Fistulifera solaris]
MVRLRTLLSSINNAEKMKHQRVPILLWTHRNEICDYVQEDIDHILFDCDGVLYRSPDVIPGARECIESLQRRGKQVFFVTNNASSSRSELRHKLTKMLRIDDEHLKDTQMVGCAYAAACYLRQQLEKAARVYVIGSPGLCDELQSAGFNVVNTPAHEPHFMDRHDMMQYSFPKDIDAVVVGHDPTFSFRKLTTATVILQQNPHALFVATNRDAYDLVGTDALRIPGNGSLVQSLECASSRVAVNVGKPSRTLAELIESEHGLNLSRTMMIGDRLDTDIQFGNDSGMFTALVLTGVTGANDIYQTLMQQDQGHCTPMPDAIFPFVGLLS